MQHARMTLPDAPANGVTGGLDWAQDDHAVAVVDSAGRQIQRFAVAHNAAGLRELVAGLATAGVTEVAIERPDARWATKTTGSTPSTATTDCDLVGGSGWCGLALGWFFASVTSAGCGRWCAGWARRCG